ncbi:MAG TPA: type III pantothenate kinase [Pirellulales bacterium]|jgi:type III pantothenate kinase
MSAASNAPLVAVDVGNSRVKLGLFTTIDGQPLPTPTSTLDIGPAPEELDRIRGWLATLAVTEPSWWIGSVQREVAGRLVGWLRNEGAARITMIASGDLPLTVALARPDKVGIDRLLDAVATNRLRRPGEPAIVADLGTAITIDLISPDGAFLGGAIMPGIATSARAMHEFTDLLPLVEMWKLGEPPSPLGTATAEAMKAGLYWGAVGGVRELVDRLAEGLPTRPRLFLSGGAAPSVARLLSEDALYVPHLTLAGIALTAAQ